MKLPGLSILILNRNAAATIEEAIKSARFAQEILVLDDRSTDNSSQIAANLADRVIRLDRELNFAAKRNELLKAATHEWIFYLDSDEVIPPKLQKEILAVVYKAAAGVYRVSRRNFFLGREMYPDHVERLFHVTKLQVWEGEVHEHPILVEPVTIHQLINPLIHKTHREIQSMLDKTNDWSEIEADLRFKANHPLMAKWRLVRMGITTFSGEYVLKKLYRYGREGLFEAYFQMIDKLIVYTKLWERQQKSS